jgi:hypothetical protein
MANHGLLDGAQRVAQKEASRRADADDLRSGRVSPAEMAQRNGFLSSVDMRGARIVAIGSREIAAFRAAK